MTLGLLQSVLGVSCGAAVGATLGLFGGGGSILAVPLMMYVVGLPNAHIAVGTSALAVAMNAATSLLEHARHGLVRWRCAAIYSVAGAAGAAGGATLGKAVDGRHLLFLFSLLMIAVAILMLRKRSEGGRADIVFTMETAPRLVGFGAAAGVVSGFFGIGGGFLIVPSLMASTGMPIINAVGSSLVAVLAFGLTTALGYARDGLVDWPLAFLFVAGGVLGSQFGCRFARHCAGSRNALRPMFAALVCVVAVYTMYRST